MSKILPGLILAFTTSVAISAPNVMELLDKMLDTARGKNYQATLVVSEANKILATRVEHWAASGNKRELERLVSLQGAKQELVIDGARMLVLLPNGKSDMVLRNPLADTFLNLHQSLDKYAISYIGEDRVAGRRTDVLAINAQDKYHYSYRLWLDKQTGLYLRGQWLDNQSRLKSEAMFTSIKFDDAKSVPEAVKRPGFNNRALTLQKSMPATITDNEVAVGWLPKGFYFKDKVMHANGGSAQIKHLVFGDGTIKISIYIDKENNGISGLHETGRTSFFGRKVKDKHITVLGEMPPMTVKRIAESLK